MRVIENGTDTLQWLLADHLGSTSVTTTDDGTLNSILKYSAFGEIWASSGVTLTDYKYTNQLEQSEIGLYYYNARWYDPQLGRFIHADTIVPGAGNAVAYDRYAYVLNNPINITDPSGNDPWYIDGWDDDYLIQQHGNTCAVVSIAVSLSILTGYRYTQEDIQPMFPHTYDFNVHLPYDNNDQLYFNTLGSLYMIPPDLHYPEVNLALGVLPWEQAFVVNTMFPGSIQASYTHGTRADLIKNLRNGCPTMITIALDDDSVGHVIVVIGFDPSTNQLQFFDPAYGDTKDENKIVKYYGSNFSTFDELWANSNDIISSNSMVTLSIPNPKPILSYGRCNINNRYNYR